MTTSQGAWWEILLGTLPRTKRLAEVIPFDPTTIVAQINEALAKTQSPQIG